MAISCHLIEANLNSYNAAHPLSDQLKACSDILSGALSGSGSVFSTLSPVRVIALSFQTQLSSLESFNRRLRGRCFVIVMLEKDMFS